MTEQVTAGSTQTRPPIIRSASGGRRAGPLGRLLLLLAVTCASLPAAAQGPPDLTAVIHRLWREVPDPPRRVAVVGIVEGHAGKATPITGVVAGAVEAAILGEKVATPVERKRLEEITAERLKIKDPQIDRKTALNLARMAQAREVVIGTVTRWQTHGMLLSLKRLDVETAEILGTVNSIPIDDASLWWSQVVPTAGGTEIDGYFSLPPDPDLGVQVWAEWRAPDGWRRGTEFHLGDRVRYQVKVNRDCYLTLINRVVEGPAPEMTVFWPNHRHPVSLLAAGQPKTITVFTIQGPPGKGQVVAVATDRPWFPESGFSPTTPMRNLLKRPLNYGTGRWNVATLDYQATAAAQGEASR